MALQLDSINSCHVGPLNSKEKVWYVSWDCGINSRHFHTIVHPHIPKIILKNVFPFTCATITHEWEYSRIHIINMYTIVLLIKVVIVAAYTRQPH